MSPDNPLISVVIPVYNGEKYISEALRSVLAQEYEPVEIIVVNDGSTDRTSQCLEKFDEKLIVIDQENCGPSVARNHGIEAASGEYITFIDSDDIWMPHKVEFHLDHFKKFADLEISLGLSAKLPFESVQDINSNTAEQSSFLHLVMGATMIKKSVFKEVGLFDEELLFGEDTDWFLRARERQKKIAISRKLLLLYREHDDSITNEKRKANLYLFKVFKKAKDRKFHSGISPETMMKKPESLQELINIWHTAESK